MIEQTSLTLSELRMAKPAPALQVYISEEERRRIYVAAASRQQSMSEFGRAAIMDEVNRSEGEQPMDVPPARSDVRTSPGQFARRLAEQFDGDVRAARRYLLRAVEALDEVQEG